MNKIILNLIKKIHNGLYIRILFIPFLKIYIRSILYQYYKRGYNFLVFKILIFGYKIEFQIGKNVLKKIDKELAA